MLTWSLNLAVHVLSALGDVSACQTHLQSGIGSSSCGNQLGRLSSSGSGCPAASCEVADYSGSGCLAAMERCATSAAGVNTTGVR